jgi:hypothetical protein
LELPFLRSASISSLKGSSLDLPLPFGLPNILPCALAAFKPCFVLSDIKSLSISAKSPKRAHVKIN